MLGFRGIERGLPCLDILLAREERAASLPEAVHECRALFIVVVIEVDG